MFTTDPLLRPYSAPELRLKIKFLDGIHRQQGCRRPADTYLVQRGVVEVGIVVVGAVHAVIVGAVAVAVDVELAKTELGAGYSRRLDGRAGHQRNQLPEIAAVERQ